MDMTSQDDLDNYVYEDQESGTHILDDDGFGGPNITHLRDRNVLMRQRIERRNDRTRQHSQPADQPLFQHRAQSKVFALPEIG